MKILSNRKNYQTLKLLIAAEFSNQSVALELVNVDDTRLKLPKHLPVLVLDSGAQIFSTNESCVYLFGTESRNDITNQWLEWESSEFITSLIAFCENPKVINSNLKAKFNALNRSLETSSYIVDSTVNSVDICIWTSLFPLLSDVKIRPQFTSYTHVINWFDNILKLPQVQKAFQTWKDLNKENVEGLSLLTDLMNLLNLSSVQDNSILNSFNKTSLKPVNNPKPVNTKKTHLSSEVSVEQDDLCSKSKEVTDEEIEVAKKSWTEEHPTPLRKRPAPILPNKDENNILITSALPYVNNVPHLGNIIGCVLSADVFSRFCRLRNQNVLYVSGTDEYGTATETKALEENLTPKEICDKYFKIHKEVYEWFNIDFDHFGRTSTKEQTEIVQDIFKQVHDNGFTSTNSVEQLLCENCNRFLADRFVEGECPKCHFEDARGDQCDGCGNLINATELIKPRCKVCRQKPVIKDSVQLFLELPKIEDKLNEWVSKTSSEWSHNARVICKAWLKEGLKPRCITRDLKWGIPVPLPGFESKVFYVWFDAPIGYMSLTQCYSNQYKTWWQSQHKITLYQFMAKDNVPFHSIMFPATMFAANKGYTIVNHIMATEYLNYEDGKFSKSRGTGVFGNNAKDTGLPADIFRFYLLYVRPESQDTSFSWADFATKNNSELLNNLGNFINRALSFIEKNYSSTIPQIQLGQDEYLLIALINREIKLYASVLEKAKLRDGIRYILNISRYCNQYMQTQKPWVLFKGTPEEKTKASTVLGLLCNVSYLLSLLLSPYMPQTANIIQSQLGATLIQYSLNSNQLLFFLNPGHKIGKPEPLFSKIEQKQIDDFRLKFGGKQEKEPKKNVATASTGQTFNSIEDLEKAVADQGNLVRQIKSSGASKSEWQPHVDKLLSLKKQLEVFKKQPPGGVNQIDAKSLEADIAKQADIVRKLKSSGVEKSVWAPDLEKLLSLKKQSELLTKGTPECANQASENSLPNHGGNDVKTLEAEISKQAAIVRKLKSSGAEKGVWASDLEKLLSLKKQLEDIVGPPSSPTSNNSSSKKKNKT